MTSTEFPTDSATDKLIAEAMAIPASETHPLYSGLDVGTDTLEVDVHVVASRWVDAGHGSEAEALCGETLVNLAYGLVDSLPMCWECADILASRA